MKTLGLKIFFALACISINLQNVIAQTLTCASTCPHAGEVFSMRTSSPVLNSAGTNQIWNFSSVAAVSPTAHIISYDPASAVPSASLYPQASLVKTNSYSGKSYISTNNGGIREIDPNAMNNGENAMVLPLPFAYGDTFTETATYTTQLGLDVFVTSFQSTITAQGSGTLILPTATYVNVLSVKYSSILSSTKNGSPFGSIYYNTSYYYYAPNISQPVLYTKQLSESGPTDYAPYTEFIDHVVLGINNEREQDANEIKVFPNPTKDILKIKISNNLEGIIQLRNSLGQLLLQQKFEGDVSTLNLTDLPEGLYFVSFNNGMHSYNKQVVLCR